MIEWQVLAVKTFEVPLLKEDACPVAKYLLCLTTNKKLILWYTKCLAIAASHCDQGP